MAKETLTRKRKRLRPHIRWMIRRDMPEVIAIENESFEWPWPKEDFIRCLQHCIGMVAEHADRVVGFMIYELHKSRIDVLNFAVAADCRRRGVGRAMVRALKQKISAARGRRSKLVFHVDERNLDAQLFLQSQGLAGGPIVPRFYGDVWLEDGGVEHRDAIRFTWRAEWD